MQTLFDMEFADGARVFTDREINNFKRLRTTKTAREVINLITAEKDARFKAVATADYSGADAAFDVQ